MGNGDLARRNRLLILALVAAVAFLGGLLAGYLPTRNALLEARTALLLCQAEKGRCEKERLALATKQEEVARLLSGLSEKTGDRRALKILKNVLEVLK